MLANLHLTSVELVCLVVPVLLKHVPPMMKLGQVLEGHVQAHVLARPQNVLKNSCPDLF